MFTFCDCGALDCPNCGYIDPPEQPEPRVLGAPPLVYLNCGELAENANFDDLLPTIEIYYEKLVGLNIEYVRIDFFEELQLKEASLMQENADLRQKLAEQPAEYADKTLPVCEQLSPAPQQATPHAQLIAELLDPTTPKTALERAAAREIERNRSRIAAGYGLELELWGWMMHTQYMPGEIQRRACSQNALDEWKRLFPQGSET